MSMSKRLNQHFAQMKDMGDEAYKEYVAKHAQEYADYYRNV
jgi:hypothetical protein